MKPMKPMMSSAGGWARRCCPVAATRCSAPWSVATRLALSLLALHALAAGAAPRSRQPHARSSGASEDGFISSTHREATLAGLEILAEGGNAADAAAAVQLALAVVQPQSTGIGGGCLVVMRNGSTGEVSALDGREEAPELFHPKVFCLDEDCLLNPDCECAEGPIPAGERQIGGLAVGVPGVIAAVARLLADNGTMTLATVARPAIELAENGFEMYIGMHSSIASNLNKLGRFEATRALFLNPAGTAPRVAVGELFTNPDMAATLRLLAEGGAPAFYTEGSLPAEIVAAAQDAVNENTGKYGLMSSSDVAGYAAVYREPVLSTYRGRQLLGMPMPSSGGVALAQIFNFLEGWEQPRRRTNFQPREMSAEMLHRFIDAQNAAFADRNVYAGDADFADVPAEGLVDKSYAASRREEISRLVSAAPAPLPAGIPAGVTTRYASAPPTAENGTTHFSVVDRAGTLVAFTTTIEANWGSGVVVPNRGFLLNNELTDFAAEGLDPETGLPYANAPEGGKRPRRTALGEDATTLGECSAVEWWTASNRHHHHAASCCPQLTVSFLSASSI
jgi:gamma-glutamyltranspeptidase/glutathione hydrolase